jgi:signal transduction histidine kinase
MDQTALVLMKKLFIYNIIALLLCMPFVAGAQANKADSLRRLIQQASNDSVKINECWNLYNVFEEFQRDSAKQVVNEGIDLSRKNNKKLAEARFRTVNAYLQLSTGHYAESLQDLLQALSIIQQNGNETNNWLSAWSGSPSKTKLLLLAVWHHAFANLMTPTLNTEQQILHYREAMRLGKEAENSLRVILANLGLGRTYLDIGRIDSALIFEKEAARIAEGSVYKRILSAIFSYEGAIYFRKGENQLALASLYKGIHVGFEYGNRSGLAQNYYRLSKYYLEQNIKDSSLFYALKFRDAIEQVGAAGLSTVDKGMAYEFLSRAYKMNGQHDSADRYQEIALVTKDSISNAKINSLAAFQTLTLKENLRLRDLEKEQALYQARVRTYGLLAILGAISVIAVILYRNNKQKQKANRTLENTLTDLRSTQAQLIQSEKMASLGELTAGIAHEIQNPLNFVNNFSEVNKEMITEAREAISAGNLEDAEEILDTVADNEQKIHHHGKRADAIVKGMLQHSQKGSGVKELTNINALADEYLRLAYHGLKAKDASFSATIETDFDERIGNINIIPQDIGRVLLNLINNAFYAVNEKKKKIGEGFEPEVTVTTRLISDTKNSLIISVTDNGNGIPQNIVDKIFQPFFTTKPTGQGTGLGLSLSYDIVKAHGGEISVESKEGEGTVFSMVLPA